MTEASKRITIHTAPMILTFQLKRFDYTRSSLGTKINKFVEYPETLDLSPFMSSPSSETTTTARYKLYAVLVHSGFSMKSGHYYNFVKNSNGLWYCMDDSEVHQVQARAALQQKAYMLFYVKDGVSPPKNATRVSNNTTLSTATQKQNPAPLTQINPREKGSKVDSADPRLLKLIQQLATKKETPHLPQSNKPLPPKNATCRPALISEPASAPKLTSSSLPALSAKIASSQNIVKNMIVDPNGDDEEPILVTPPTSSSSSVYSGSPSPCSTPPPIILLRSDPSLVLSSSQEAHLHSKVAGSWNLTPYRSRLETDPDTTAALTTITPTSSPWKVQTVKDSGILVGWDDVAANKKQKLEMVLERVIKLQQEKAVVQLNSFTADGLEEGTPRSILFLPMIL